MENKQILLIRHEAGSGKESNEKRKCFDSIFEEI